MTNAPHLRAIQTFVGRPASIGATRNGPVISAIHKRLVDESTLELSTINLAGDDQADRSVHGGPEKAVYCYPSEHAAAWQADGFTLPPGAVGENVSTTGGLETDLRIGDTYRWGTAIIQINQPRAPCFKLTMFSGRKDIGPHLIETKRCGWYVRVLTPGTVETSGALEFIDRDETAPTVAETFSVMFSGVHPEADDADVVRRVVQCSSLSPEWLGYVAARNPLAHQS